MFFTGNSWVEIDVEALMFDIKGYLQCCTYTLGVFKARNSGLKSQVSCNVTLLPSVQIKITFVLIQGKGKWEYIL